MATITLNGLWFYITSVGTAAFFDTTNDTAFVINDNVFFFP